MHAAAAGLHAGQQDSPQGVDGVGGLQLNTVLSKNHQLESHAKAATQQAQQQRSAPEMRLPPAAAASSGSDMVPPPVSRSCCRRRAGRTSPTTMLARLASRRPMVGRWPVPVVSCGGGGEVLPAAPPSGGGGDACCICGGGGDARGWPGRAGTSGRGGDSGGSGSCRAASASALRRRRLPWGSAAGKQRRSSSLYIDVPLRRTAKPTTCKKPGE